MRTAYVSGLIAFVVEMSRILGKQLMRLAGLDA